MYEKITKKAFIEMLKKSENEIIYTNLCMSETGCTKIMDLIYKNHFEVKNGRKCTAANSNSLTFSNGSKLGFEEIAECYKHDNVILTLKCWWDAFDEIYKNAIIAYVIK